MYQCLLIPAKEMIQKADSGDQPLMTQLGGKAGVPPGFGSPIDDGAIPRHIVNQERSAVGGQHCKQLTVAGKLKTTTGLSRTAFKNRLTFGTAEHPQDPLL